MPTKLKALLDTGSTVSFIKEKFINHYNFCNNHNFYGINQSKLTVLGQKFLFMKIFDKIIEFNFLIVPNNTSSYDLILGSNILNFLNIGLVFIDKIIKKYPNFKVKNDYNKITDENNCQKYEKCLNQDEVKENPEFIEIEKNYFEQENSNFIEEENDLLLNNSQNLDYFDNEINSFMSINYVDDTDNVLIKLDHDYPLEFEKNFREILDKYFRADFNKHPETSYEMEIILTKNEPFNYLPRRVSIHERNELKNILTDLLNEGIIRPSKSPYCSPIVLIKKKNGSLRMCVDYRTLNKITLRDNFPIPLIEDQLLLLNNKKFFTSLDLKNGFHHVSVHENSIPFTSFITPHGQYEYTKMPFGLKNAPSVFTRYIRSIFDNLAESGNILIFLDDILIATENLEDHLEMLRKVFDLLIRNNLRLNFEKCKFVQQEIEYLGYQVDQYGISPTKKGIESIINYPVPQNIKQVHTFIGLCSYFRKFILGFSLLAKPLYDLLRKNAEFKFEQPEISAFEELKDQLVSTPILSIYNPNDDTELHCDASSLGFGAILLQRKSDKKLHPIFYFSKRTTETESKYHSFELETLAIIYALQRFKVYLQGIKFKIVTDCNSLTMTLNKKDINPRIARWASSITKITF